jgi:hypothetical protein
LTRLVGLRDLWGSNISADDVVGSGGLPVFVDEAAEDRLSDDA